MPCNYDKCPKCGDYMVLTHHCTVDSKDVQQRIAAIIEEHLTCDCGEWAENIDETVQHIASMITETLGLSNPEDDLTKLTEELGLYDHQSPANPSEPV